jgi:hypothetical protein
LRNIGVCQCTHASVHRLDDRDVGLAQEQVGEDERVGRALPDAPAGELGPVTPLERGREVGDHGAGGAAEPLERPLVAGGPVDLDVSAAPVTDDRLDRLLLAHHALVLRAHRLEQRLVYETEVIAVAVVLGQHLPVGRAAVLHPARRQLDLAGRRQVARPVDQPGGRAQVVGEARPLRAQAREHEAAVARHPRRPGEAVGALVEVVVAAGVGHPEQLAAQVVRPAVVRAGEGAGVTAVGRAQHRAAMHAAVDEHGHGAVPAAHHDDRLAPEGPGDVVARPRDLAVVADEDPAALEDPVQLVG